MEWFKKLWNYLFVPVEDEVDDDTLVNEETNIGNPNNPASPLNPFH